MKTSLTHCAAGAVLAFAASAAGCSHTSGKPDTDSSADTAAAAEEYHADNDIAMTVRSLADAIRVGEPLTGEDYDQEKTVMTDGEGYSLYSDLTGSPGMWSVKVLSPTAAEISNTALGDLVPDDLETYLASALEIGEAQKVDDTVTGGKNPTRIVLYDFGGGYLRIETKRVAGQANLEGVMVRVALQREPGPLHRKT